MTSSSHTSQVGDNNNSALLTPEHSAALNDSQTMDEASAGGSIPKVALGPPVSTRLQTSSASEYLSPARNSDNLAALHKELDTQERIIVTLQRDNEALLREKKEIANRCKELELNFEHLEAKHSLLLSAQQDFGSRSNLRLANDAAKIASLQTQVLELQSSLEAEKLKVVAATTHAAAAQPAASSPAEVIAKPTQSTQKEPLSSGQVLPPSTAQKADDHSSRLREYERIHEIHKATIDKLHAEVGRLEAVKREMELRQQTSSQELERLTKRTRELERIVDEKKESIGELLRSCQDGAANAQRLKKQETRIRSLEAALAEKDEFTQKAMERLRSDTKEVCNRYQDTITNLQKALDEAGDTAELQQRLSALEKENLELRRVASAQKNSPAQSRSIESTFETEAKGEAGNAVPQSSTHEGDVAKSAQLTADLRRLEAANAEATADAERYKNLSSKLQTEILSIRAEWEAKVQEIKRKFALQLQTMRSSHNDELDRLEAGHRSELQELSRHKSQSDGDGFAAKLIDIVEKKGYDASLVAIGERLSYLEKRSLQKEQEMAYELAEVKRVAEMEKRIFTEKKKLQLEQKNLQINSFRVQLDELLASIAVLQATSQA